MKTLLFTLMCCFTLCSFCQDKKLPIDKDQQYYLHKSKEQLVVGLSFIGIGLLGFALTTTNSQSISDIPTNIIWIGGGAVATFIGTVTLISCVANNAKAKRATVFLGLDKISIVQKANIQKVYNPEFGIRIKW